jgi:hypothetical protein
MKHKVKRIHFVASERAQSRSLLLSLAIAAYGRARQYRRGKP